MTREYIIFVPGAEVDEDTASFSEVVDWGWQHLAHPNVMQLTEDDLYLLDRQTRILEIVSEENGNSMIGFGEDDSVYDADAKRRIYERLDAYLAGAFPGNRFETSLELDRAQRLTRQLLGVLKVSINTDRSIQFRF